MPNVQHILSEFIKGRLSPRKFGRTILETYFVQNLVNVIKFDQIPVSNS
jgi:hypothetical protein